MISCTEFIPAYSELFAFIEEKNGYEAVEQFWKYLFEPDGKGVPLINHLKAEGIRGCFTYWTETLNEEAADFTMYLNEKAGWFLIDMHACPSKGRLLGLKEEKGYTPYDKYCLHCDGYRYSVEKAGYRYIYNFMGNEHAACRLLVYDPEIFDGRIIVDEATQIMDRKAAQNEYFHRDFHSFMNNGIEYIGRNYGMEGVADYLTGYVKKVCVKELERLEKEGLLALKVIIEDIYKKERALDVLRLELSNDSLKVTVDECPAVKHLKQTGRVVSSWYRYTTEIMMQIFAKQIGYSFTLNNYDEETGAAFYQFQK